MRMGVKLLVVTAALSIHSPERQRRLLNWSVPFIGLLFILSPEWFSRYKWDSTSGGVDTAGPAHVADNLSTSVNGCSMKTEANLAAVKAIPPGKIMFETGQFIPDPRHRFTFSTVCYRCRFSLVFDDRQPRITTPH